MLGGKLTVGVLVLREELFFVFCFLDARRAVCVFVASGCFSWVCSGLCRVFFSSSPLHQRLLFFSLLVFFLLLYFLSTLPLGVGVTAAACMFVLTLHLVVFGGAPCFTSPPAVF